MSYRKQHWSDTPNKSTPLSAERLNHLETQYEESRNFTLDQISNISFPVLSVNGKQGNLTLTSSDVSAAPNSEFYRVYGLYGVYRDIYVDPSGNDTSGEGTIDKPFRTIQRAFNSIPKLVDRDTTVWVSAGDYNEEASLQGVSGAGVFVRRRGGVVSASGNTGVRVRGLRFYEMNCYVFVQNLTFYNSSSISASQVVLFSRCQYGTVNACRFDSDLTSSSKESIKWDGSGGGVNSSYFARQNVCVLSLNGSAVRVDSTNVHEVSNSNTHVVAQAGIVYFNGPVGWVSQIKLAQGGLIRENDSGFTQSGFVFSAGDGTGNLIIPVTFPRPYTQPPLIQLTFIGARPTSQGVPTDPGSFTADWSDFRGVIISFNNY